MSCEEYIGGTKRALTETAEPKKEKEREESIFFHPAFAIANKYAYVGF